MADQSIAIDATPRPEASSTLLQIAVLAALMKTDQEKLTTVIKTSGMALQ